MVWGNALVGQSGGPTSVINSSLYGVIRQCITSDSIASLYGMKWGIEGLLQNELIRLDNQPVNIIEGLKQTPSSALGSSRYKLQDNDLDDVLDMLKCHDIRYMFLIGGNDTMDTIHRVVKYCKDKNYELFGIGIPKTVDNDLFGTDYTPGYPSAARYNALSVQQSGRLAKDMQKVDSFVIYQTIGRDSGWLAAATSLSRREEGDPPHLIYLPERPFDNQIFVEDAKKAIETWGFASIVVSEGIKHKDGTPVSSSGEILKDKFGNTEYGSTGGGSVALNLHTLLFRETGLRGEFQIGESLPMCAIDRAVESDIERAIQCGVHAVTLAVSEQSGVMVTLVRNSGNNFMFDTISLKKVAINARAMNDNMINTRGNDITSVFYDYARPLVGDFSEYVSFKDSENS